MKTLGQNIRDRRKAMGLTLVELGEQVGVGKDTVKNWEFDNTIPNALLFYEVAKALNTTCEALFEGGD